MDANHKHDFAALLKKHPDLKVVDCHLCGELMAANGQAENGGLPTAQTMRKRPTCGDCIELSPHSCSPIGMPATPDDIDPWQENAIRAMEDGQWPASP